MRETLKALIFLTVIISSQLIWSDASSAQSIPSPFTGGDAKQRQPMPNANPPTPEQSRIPVTGPRSLEEVFQEEFDQVIKQRPDDSEFRRARQAVRDTIRGVASDDPAVRFDSEILLQRIARTPDLPALFQALKEYAEKPEAQIAIIRVLGKMGDPRAVEPLRKEFDYVGRDAQIAIADALGDIRDESVVPLLASLLRTSTDPDYLFHTLSALAKIGDSKAIYAIESSFQLLPQGAPRLAAKWALDVAKNVVRPDYTDTLFQPGRKSLFFYKGMLYYFIRPTTLHRDTNDPMLLVCIHGTTLNVQEVYDACASEMKERRLAVLAPFFDPVFFPDYHQMNVRRERSDLRLLELIDYFGKHAKVRTDRFYLFGYERGGEFVQRFAFAHPERIARTSFYTSYFQELSTDVQFPVGLKTSPAVPDLKFDMEKILTLSFAPIVDQVLESSRAYKAFIRVLETASNDSMLFAPFQIIRIDQREGDLVRTIRAASAYLFPSREIRPLVPMVPAPLAPQGATSGTGYSTGG